MSEEIHGATLLKDVLKLEADALLNASTKIKDEEVQKVLQIYEGLLKKGGKLVFIGVGKSGWIANKLAATFSSLGLTSIFLHPTEALHGDLGRVTENDAAVLISKSGTSEEIQKLIPFLPIQKSSLIALVGDPTSPLAKSCDVFLDCSVEKEACLNNQAPTTSSTLAMAMGDALAVLFEKKVGLSKEGFAANHPGGMLGKSLLMVVENLMWPLSDCPRLGPDSTLKDAILEMTSKNLGGCAILDNQETLLGIVVEGDIRRSFTGGGQGVDTKLSEIMNQNPVQVSPDSLAIEALGKMEKRQSQISILPVVKDGKFKGFIRLHDLIREGFKIS